MYIRVKRFKNKDGTVREYLYLVKGVRENGRARQKVIAYLGRLDELKKDGAIDSLVRGLARYAERVEVIDAAQDLFCPTAKEYGAVVVFRKVWNDLGLEDLLSGYAAERGCQFDVVEAIFVMVLNRLLAPCSKLRVPEWIQGVEETGVLRLALHHFYRAMDVLVTNKERLEEDLFSRKRDLFSQEVDLVFFDTTTVSIYGEGPGGLAERGFSKSKRPDLKQIIVAVVMTKEGVPIAHEVFPGSTADVVSFARVISSLKERFAIEKVVVVSDRGTVSEGNLRMLAELDLCYIVGVRMRRVRAVDREVLARPGRYQVVRENLKVKEVHHAGQRYIVCLNEEEARKDEQSRKAMVEALEEKLKQGGLKCLIGNKGYRRFLKVEGTRATVDPARLAAERRYDGKYVLRTNTDLPADAVALAYKGLWQVEAAFRELKSQLEVGPIYHWAEPRVRAHVFICFLALQLEVALKKKLEAVEQTASYHEVLRDLALVKAVHVRLKERTYRVRTDLAGNAYQAFKAAGMAPPQRVVPIEDGVVGTSA